MAWVSACLLSSAAIASSATATLTTTVPTATHVALKSRAEVFLGVSLKSIERSELSPANATRYYDASFVATIECTVAPSSAARQLRLPKTDATLSGTNTFGYAAANGDVFLRPGMPRALQAHVLRHERVHSFLSVADDAPLAGLRQGFGVGAYSNSAFFNAVEETLAEGIASGSLRQGWKHAFNGEYVVRERTQFEQIVTKPAFYTELGVGATGLGLFGYGAYQIGGYLFGNE
jgi:hypothetical protein